MADVVRAREMNEHHLGLMPSNHVDGVFGDLCIGGGGFGGDPHPIEGAGFGERGELGFSGGHRGGVVFFVGDFKERGEVRIDRFFKREIFVPFDLMLARGDTGEHARVRRKGDGHRRGAGPATEAAGLHQTMEVGGAGAQGQVGAQAIDADDEHPGRLSGGRFGQGNG